MMIQLTEKPYLDLIHPRIMGHWGLDFHSTQTVYAQPPPSLLISTPFNVKVMAASTIPISVQSSSWWTATSFSLERYMKIKTYSNDIKRTVRSLSISKTRSFSHCIWPWLMKIQLGIYCHHGEKKRASIRLKQNTD